MEKLLSAYSKNEILKAVEDRNLFSEELSSAGRLIDRLDDPKMKDSFDKLAKALLTGENAERGGSGFGNRNNIGLGIQHATRGDFGVLDRFIGNANAGTASETVVALAETMKARLEMYCERGGIEIVSDDIASPSAPQSTASPALGARPKNQR